MINTSKNESSLSKAAPFIIIGGFLAIIIIGGIILQRLIKQAITSTGQSVARQKNDISFKSFDSEEYVLYLPQNLEDTERKVVDGKTYIHYGDTSDRYSKDAGIHFLAVPKSEWKDTDTCEKDFDETRKNLQTGPGAKFISGEQIDLPNATVCDSSWTTPIDGKFLKDTVMTHQRIYIGKNPKHNFNYYLMGQYFESHPERFKKGIEESLLKFEVK